MSNSEKEYSTPPAKDKKKARAKLKHALIDVDFADKQKTKALIFKHGQLSAWYLTRLILLISKSTDAIIELDAALQVAQEIGLSNGEEILTYLHSKEMISVLGDYVTQTRVAEDQESLKEDQEYWKNKKREERETKEKLVGQELDISRNADGSMNLVKNEPLNCSNFRKGEAGETLFIDLSDADPPEIIPEGVKIGLPGLRFERGEWMDLLINHYRGNQKSFLEDVRTAAFTLQSKGESSKNPKAYMRKWLMKKAQFDVAQARAGPQKAKNQTLDEAVAILKEN